MAEEVFNAGNADMNNITTRVMNEEDIPSEATEVKIDENTGKPELESLKVDEDGITEYVNKDMLIGDIITWYPDAALVLMKCGMHCISCGVSQFESLDQACAVHGLYTDDVAKVVNDYLTQTLGGKEERLAEEKQEKL